MIASGGRLAAAITVAASAAYIVVLTSGFALVKAGVLSTPFGEGATAQVVLGVLSIAFLAVALVVATVVVTNAFTLVTATRLRDIALRRLLGASARTERRRILREGARLSLAASGVGLLVGAAGVVGLMIAAAAHREPGQALAITDVVDPSIVLPLIALQGCVVLAAWRGSAAVVSADPATALGAAIVTESGGDGDRRIGWAARVLLATGLILLGLSVLGGALTPLAAFVGVAGGTVLAAGILASATGILPRFLRLIARILPRRGPAAIARATLAEHPARTARAALAITIGVSIVTMFAVASASTNLSLRLMYAGTPLEDSATSVIDDVLGIVGVLVAMIVLIAAVGLATSVALGTRLRGREIAARRVLGQSRRHAVISVVLETVVICATATLAGLLLGAVLGWVGAQSVLGSALPWKMVVPAIPVSLVAVLAAGTLLVAVASAVMPVRFVMTDSPIRAFARA